MGCRCRYPRKPGGIKRTRSTQDDCNGNTSRANCRWLTSRRQPGGRQDDSLQTPPRRSERGLSYHVTALRAGIPVPSSFSRTPGPVRINSDWYRGFVGSTVLMAAENEQPLPDFSALLVERRGALLGYIERRMGN